MLTLTLDAALARISAAVVEEERVLAAQIRMSAPGAALLPVMAAEVLAQAGIRPRGLGLIGVTVGPGGFTGIRGALSLAHGIGLAADVPVVGVTVPEALEAMIGPELDRPFWVAIDSKRGRIFLAIDGVVTTCALEALPIPDTAIALAGDAADAVAARLAERGADVTKTSATLPEPVGIARAAHARWRGELAPLPAQPLYVDPPAVSRPAAAPRPFPVG